MSLDHSSTPDKLHTEHIGLCSFLSNSAVSDISHRTTVYFFLTHICIKRMF